MFLYVSWLIGNFIRKSWYFDMIPIKIAFNSKISKWRFKMRTGFFSFVCLFVFVVVVVVFYQTVTWGSTDTGCYWGKIETLLTNS